MAGPATNDVCLMRHICFALGQYSINDYYAFCNGNSGGGLTYNQIAQGLDTVLSAAILPTMPSNAFSFGWTISKVNPLPRSIQGVYQNNQAGSVAGTNLAPPQVAPLISFRSAKITAGKGVRGRVYMPFTARDNLGAGVLTSGAQTNYGAWRDQFTSGNITLTDGVGTIQLQPCTVVKTMPIWEAYAIDSGAVHSAIAQQKRRSLYRHGDKPPF